MIFDFLSPEEKEKFQEVSKDDPVPSTFCLLRQGHTFHEDEPMIRERIVALANAEAVVILEDLFDTMNLPSTEFTMFLSGLKGINEEIANVIDAFLDLDEMSFDEFDE
uniref:DUF1788 domain-containing protein n=1 Tax=Steinernema glaseri TaxID=37863 RepID=A0A1I7YV32_9BILA